MQSFYRSYWNDSITYTIFLYRLRSGSKIDVQNIKENNKNKNNSSNNNKTNRVEKEGEKENEKGTHQRSAVGEREMALQVEATVLITTTLHPIQTVFWIVLVGHHLHRLGHLVLRHLRLHQLHFLDYMELHTFLECQVYHRQVPLRVQVWMLPTKVWPWLWQPMLPKQLA